MLAYARNFVTPEDAEEVVQDVMVWLWENRKTLEIKSSLKSYLFRSVRNSCMTRIAQGQAQQRLRQAVFEKMQPYYEDVDTYSVEILTQKIEEALGRLPESYRIAFEKNRFEDKTYPEIAAELNVSVKTVEYRMTQALKQLRVELKEYLPVTILCLWL
jgi:RNA polymerase sigma-70 factor (ECF subfamily)